MENNKKLIKTIYRLEKQINESLELGEQTKEKLLGVVNDIICLVTFKEDPSVIMSDIEEIIDFWNDLGMCSHRRNSKRYQRIVDDLKMLMEGTFFLDKPVSGKYKDKEFSKKEIMQVIRRYARFREKIKTDTKINLNDFLHNSFNGMRNKSAFLNYYQETQSQDENSDLTRCLFVLYGKQFYDWNEFKLSYFEKQKFILAAKKLKEYYVKNIGLFIIKISLNEFADIFFESLKEHFPNTTIKPGHFCSDYSFNIVLPAYLKDQHIIFND